LLEIRSINDHTTLGLLDLAEFSKQQKINVKRDLERAGTGHLLATLFSGQEIKLSYTSFRKPFLEGRSEHLSISHSHDKLAILVNRRENTGVDIELIRDKVKNIQEKFLNDHELSYARDRVDLLLTLWAAKEAMYKVHGEKELEFARHLQVPSILGNEFEGRVVHENHQKRYWLRSENIQNYKLVYVLHEIQEDHPSTAKR
jgi:4'-phosphopantetheinyl transferase